MASCRRLGSSLSNNKWQVVAAAGARVLRGLLGDDGELNVAAVIVAFVIAAVLNTAAVGPV